MIQRERRVDREEAPAPHPHKQPRLDDVNHKLRHHQLVDAIGRGVAAQVAFEKAKFETSFSLDGFDG
jgi:hypothetical protein